jgi:hypothetical protein
MLNEVDQAPLFPLEAFADLLAKTTNVLGRHPRFREVTERVDDLIAKRSGNAVAAEKSFDRAAAYLDQDDLINAIRQLHRAKIKWFSGETLEQTLEAILLLSRCYLQLRLAHAAKYYALAAAFIAHHSDRDSISRYLPRALAGAADSDDASGNSLSFLQTLLMAIDAQCCFDPNPLDAFNHPSVKANLEQVSALRGLAVRSGPDWLSPIDSVLALWPPELREPIDRASEDPTGFWFRNSWEAAWSTIEESFLGRPFGDMGKRRVFEWKALGVHWVASFDNTYSCTPEAEQFIAQFQIGLAACAGVDLCPLPTRVAICISVHTGRRKVVLKEIRSEGESCWSLRLPAKKTNIDSMGNSIDTLAIFSAIIEKCSLLPTERLLNLLQDVTLDGGLFERILVARPYAKIYREFMSPGIFNDALRAETKPFKPDLPFAVQQHPVLSWVDGPGPTYSDRIAMEGIRMRYERGMKAVGITVKRLMQAPDTRRLLLDLHEAGLKDWEVLSIALNAATNLRLKPRPGQRIATNVRRFEAAFEVEEQISTALSPQEFTPEIIKASRDLFLGAHAGSWELAMRGSVFDLSALEALLISRYGLRRDDVDHENIFDWSGGESAEGQEPPSS